MTKRQFHSKFNALLIHVKAKARARAEELVTSGALDLPSTPDDYGIPRTVLLVVLHELAEQMAPRDPKYRRVAKNLEHF